jgi:hypothetical protein
VRTRKRQHERFVSDLLVCELGTVLDLSASGVRIAAKGRCKLKRGDLIPLALKAPQGSLTLRARVVRIERRGFRAYELGLEFVGMKPSTCHALRRLAEFGFVAQAGIAGSTVGSFESGGMGGGPRAASPAEMKASPAAMKLDRAREILCVGHSATADDIRAAYRKLAHRYHPDAKPGPEAESRFADIVAAYRMLRDVSEARPAHG